MRAMREHYVWTVRAWLETLEKNWDAVVALVGEEVARVWRLYMVGGALVFEEGRMGVDQILAVKRSPAARRHAPRARRRLPRPLNRQRPEHPSAIATLLGRPREQVGELSGYLSLTLLDSMHSIRHVVCNLFVQHMLCCPHQTCKPLHCNHIVHDWLNAKCHCGHIITTMVIGTPVVLLLP